LFLAAAHQQRVNGQQRRTRMCAMPAFREEIFGPVAPVTVVKDDGEAVAVAVAVDTEYGLVAAIQTGSRDRGRLA
jgi:acyl-CoA reductase-like NAD-dependent aldehyde dehydrogenase